MAVKGYGYDPRPARSPTAKEIASDLAELDISLDEDTIRSRLREAADEFGDRLPPPDEPKPR